jgi:D-alanine-D-alanine ligase
MARIAIVRGGRSLERDFSLQSGHNVAAALRHTDHTIVEVDVDGDLTKTISDCDVVFIALHGRDGEDGTLQATCEALGVSYTGSAPLTCRLAFDKGLTKGMLRRAGLPTPPGYVVSSDAVSHMGAGTAMRRAADRLGYPVVLKPAAQGSALGLSVVHDATDLTAAAMAAFDHGDRVLVERFVPGGEVSVCVVGSPLEALPAVEIRTTSGVHDFETRISPGASEYVCPATLPDTSLRAASSVAVEVAKTLGVRDFARVDIRIGPDGPQVLDIKTCPGLTEGSILPLAAAQGGRAFEDLVREIVDAALARSKPRAVPASQ